MHAQHVHHRLAGDADLLADDAVALLEAARDHALLHVVGVLDRHVGMRGAQRRDRRARDERVVERIAQGFDGFLVHVRSSYYSLMQTFLRSV